MNLEDITSKVIVVVVASVVIMVIAAVVGIPISIGPINIGADPRAPDTIPFRPYVSDGKRGLYCIEDNVAVPIARSEDCASGKIREGSPHQERPASKDTAGCPEGWIIGEKGTGRSSFDKVRNSELVCNEGFRADFEVCIQRSLYT